jgi:hypothetical protein
MNWRRGSLRMRARERVGDVDDEVKKKKKKKKETTTTLS